MYDYIRLHKIKQEDSKLYFSISQNPYILEWL